MPQPTNTIPDKSIIIVKAQSISIGFCPELRFLSDKYRCPVPTKKIVKIPMMNRNIFGCMDAKMRDIKPEVNIP